MSATPEAPPPAEPPVAERCPTCGAPLEPGQEWCLECGEPTHARVARARGSRLAMAIVAVVVLLAGAGVAVGFVLVSDDSTEVAASSTPTATTPSTPTTPTATTSSTPGVGASTTLTPAPSAPGAPENEGDTPGTTTPGTTTPGPATTPTAPESPSATTPQPPASASKPTQSPTIDSWPPGRSAYTAVLVSATSRSGARKAARKLAGHGSKVGVLNSSDYSSLEPGYWVVFSGLYPSLAKAQNAAEGWNAQGAKGAYGRYVKSGG